MVRCSDRSPTRDRGANGRLVMTLIFRAIIFSILAIVSLSGASSLPPEKSVSKAIPAYPVKFSIIYNNKTLGAPVLHIRDGGSAMIMVERQNGYALRAELTRKIMNSRVMASLNLEFYRENDGRWEKVATPQLFTPFGKTVTYNLDRPTGGQPILQLEATVGHSTAVTSSKPNNCTASKVQNWRSALAMPVNFAAAQSDPNPKICCQGGCFQCCGDAACCADPVNCVGSCCT